MSIYCAGAGKLSARFGESQRLAGEYRELERADRARTSTRIPDSNGILCRETKLALLFQHAARARMRGNIRSGALDEFDNFRIRWSLAIPAPDGP